MELSLWTYSIFTAMSENKTALAAGSSFDNIVRVHKSKLVNERNFISHTMISSIYILITACRSRINISTVPTILQLLLVTLLLQCCSSPVPINNCSN